MTASTSALSAPDASRIAASAGASTLDRIAHLKVSALTLPLSTPISDAKVLTGRQKPMTEVAFLLVEVTTEGGQHGHRLLLLQAGRWARVSSRMPRRSRRC